MSIIANNSYRYNYEMELWLLKDYTAEDLIDNWNEIFEYAKCEKNEDNTYFLADCLDVLYEKVMTLPDAERFDIIDRAKHDMSLYML